MPGTAGRSGGDRVSCGKDGFPQSDLVVPQSLGDDEKQVWHQLVEMIPADLLRAIDCFQLQVLSESIVHINRLAQLMRADPDDHKASTRYLQFGQHITRLSAQFGLSPADRSRLKFEPPDPDDDASEWEQQ